MKQALVYRLFHVIICPFLVFGWWIFPRMEISGAALTSVISQTLGMLMGLRILLTGRSRIKLTLKNFHLDVDVIWRMVKIGFPALISGVQRNLSQFILMWFMVPFGTMAVAAHSIKQRIEMLLMMPAIAFGMASGVLMGQHHFPKINQLTIDMYFV
ncbi:MAG: MATE family efflux transporter [Chloroflexi bacterium]|nr:MATE family efflux transporter [Chloroflexota bacterium]